MNRHPFVDAPAIAETTDAMALIDAIHAATRRLTDNLGVHIRYTDTEAGRYMGDYDSVTRTLYIPRGLGIGELLILLQRGHNLIVLGPQAVPDLEQRPQLRLVPTLT